MKVLAVRVQNFRSVVDSERVDLNDRVTVLIGKNEQGKTNFLRGLLSFNPKSRYTPSDLPSHLRARLEEAKSAEIPMVTLWLSPSAQDRARLKTLVPNIDAIEEFIVTKYFDAHYSYDGKEHTGTAGPVRFTLPDLKTHSNAMIKEAESLKAKLNAHAARFPTFAPAIPQADAHITQFVSSNFDDGHRSKTWSTRS